MSLMCDRIMTDGLHRPAMVVNTVDVWERVAGNFVRSLQSAQIISIENVAQYYWAGTSQDYWDITTDFPNVAPPFPSFWMEYRVPTRILLPDGVKENHAFGGMGIGILFTATTIDEVAETLGVEGVKRNIEDYANWIEKTHGERITRQLIAAGLDTSTITKEKAKEVLNKSDYAMFMYCADARRNGIDDSYFERVKEMGVRWGLQAEIVMEVRKGTILGPIMEARYPINHTGQVMQGHTLSPVADPEFVVDAMENIGTLVYPAFLALSFMHCKNVTLETTDPPAKLSKAFQRRHGRPLVRYHTLNIEPMRRVLKHEGQSETTGLKKAMHICRGHFKDYSKHGLFGKYKGMYWWESHVRGSADEGAVLKDYNVTTPRRA